MFYGASHIDPYFTVLMVERYIKARRNAPADAVATTAAETQLARFIPVIEQRLAGAGYIAHDFGLADIAIGCTVELSPLLSYDLGPYPNIRNWLERLQGRESWRAASAPAPNAH